MTQIESDTTLSKPSVNGREKQSPLVEFKKITKVYGSGKTAIRAMDGIDLKIYRGEFVAIMGPSGSGKSTCLNLMGCLDSPTSGSYRFRDVEIGNLSRNQRALLRRNYLGFVFQGYNLLKRTTALENVEMPLVYRRVKKSIRDQKAMKALAAVSLEGREHHTPSQLSGGEQQRVAIARAIVTNPSLLLADEPTGNLDSRAGEEIMELLTRLNREQDITVVMVTHEPDMAIFAERTIHFLDGRIANSTYNGRKER
ncbi:MAG TPA: ABC transporter ATP-binding protein [Balneolaceae bacterium]|nr:ABC transporter ATP-binding protein [Balneolaceae bacterium]